MKPVERTSPFGPGGLPAGAAPAAETPDFVRDLGLAEELRDAIHRSSETHAPGATEAPTALPQHLLLTGATGYVGSFLLAELLSETNAQISCLVRADSEAHGLERLEERAEYYGTDDLLDLGRVDVVTGDVSRPEFGNPDRFRNLSRDVDCIVHSAAAVSFVMPYRRARPATVLGTRNVLELATEGRQKSFHLVSSIAVLESADLAGQLVDESLVSPPASGITMGYSKAKWAAEQLVITLARAGLPATIYRAPLISGHSETARWNETDFLIRLLRATAQLGSTPVFDFDIDAMPVDVVSRAIARGVSTDPWQALRLVHLNSTRPLPWEEIPAVFDDMGLPLRVVTYEEWLEHARQEAFSRKDSPLYPFRALFLRKDGSGRDTVSQLYRRPFRPTISNERSRAYLAALGLELPDFRDLLRGPYASLIREYQ